MRLPLILGARPQFSVKGPTVMVPEGAWEIVTENMRDTKLRLDLSFGNDLQQSFEINGTGERHSFMGLCRAQLTFVHRGSEDYVSVFAELKK